VVEGAARVRSSVVASQDKLHAPFGGVVPEIAARAHLERILPVIDEALRRAGIGLHELGAVAVATTPGLAGSLLVGLTAAKAMALALDVPLVGVDHLQAHVYACQMAADRPVYPCVALVVSGGHTSLFHCRTAIDFELLGGTIDDAAGEAFDKVASLLGLPYPGGPAIERAAQGGNPRAVALPRALLDEPDRLEFSFSGLKTAVRYRLFGQGKPLAGPAPLGAGELADLAASFQQAVVDCLVQKSLAALRQTGLARLCVAGGVAANRRLAEALFAAAAEPPRFELHVAPRALCTDNAAMGAIAVEKLRAGMVEGLELDVQPGLVRPPRAGSPAAR
jgi:N6-L-threonylcarbamoyladenine synthase